LGHTTILNSKVAEYGRHAFVGAFCSRHKFCCAHWGKEELLMFTYILPKQKTYVVLLEKTLHIMQFPQI
jgi:hypothetical protein